MLAIIKFVIIKLLHEVGFRIMSIVMYPIAYTFRWEIRELFYGKYKEFFEEISFEDTRMIAKPNFTIKERLVLSIWMFLDDSPAKDDITEIRKDSYNLSNTWDSAVDPKGYPFGFFLKYRWLRDYWWSNIRNSHVNYFSYFITGGWTPDIKTIYGKYDKQIGYGWFKDYDDANGWLEQKANGWFIIDVKHKNGERHPFFIYSSNNFTLSIGKDSGSGRESFSIKLKKK